MSFSKAKLKRFNEGKTWWWSSVRLFFSLLLILVEYGSAMWRNRKMSYACVCVSFIDSMQLLVSFSIVFFRVLFDRRRGRVRRSNIISPSGHGLSTFPLFSFNMMSMLLCALRALYTRLYDVHDGERAVLPCVFDGNQYFYSTIYQPNRSIDCTSFQSMVCGPRKVSVIVLFPS